jgi:hypothetical protein
MPGGFAGAGFGFSSGFGFVGSGFGFEVAVVGRGLLVVVDGRGRTLTGFDVSAGAAEGAAATDAEGWGAAVTSGVAGGALGAVSVAAVASTVTLGALAGSVAGGSGFSSVTAAATPIPSTKTPASAATMIGALLEVGIPVAGVWVKAAPVIPAGFDPLCPP